MSDKPTRTFKPGVEENNPRDLDGNPIGGGPWIRIDGLVIHQDARSAGYLLQPDTRNSGSYGSNHGWLQVSDEKGHLYMAADTDLVRKSLKEGGYKNNGGWVTMSHGELFGDMGAQTEFERMRKLSHPREQQDRLINDRMIDVTDAYYAENIPLKRGLKQVKHKTADIGTYNISDTGIIAIVNTEGQVRIGIQNTEVGGTYIANANNLEEYLKKNGYKKSDTLEVPFAHGEKPFKMQEAIRWGSGSDKPMPVLDEKLDHQLHRLRDTREYEVTMRTKARESEAGRKEASEFLSSYRGSKPIGAYAAHMAEKKARSGEHDR